MLKIERYIMQLANVLILEVGLCGRSLIRIRKSKEPRTLQCGTQEDMSIKEEEKLFTTINC